MSRPAPAALAALAFLSFVSCSKPPQKGDDIVNKLEPTGFFRHAGPSADSFRAELREKGFPALFGASGRLFHADAQALAKGGVMDFVQKVRPFLEKEGVVLPEIKELFVDKEYKVTLTPANGPTETFTIWGQRELEAELSDRPGITAGFAAAKTVALLNKFLQSSPSKERAYGLHSAASFSVMFLTEEQHAIIRADPLGYAVMTPYVPTLNYPSFGQLM